MLIQHSQARQYTIATAALLTLMTCTIAYADDTHYNNILIGERASGLGGAYTAISDDTSGLYYNPAGIVYAGTRNFTASVNAFHKTQVRYKSVIGGDDWVRTSSHLLPNFFGATQPMLGGMVGLSYAVTDSIVEDQDFTTYNPNSSVSQFTMNLNTRDNTTKIGPSYAKELTESLSIGVTLYAHIRDFESINNQWYSFTDGSDLWFNRYMETSEFGIDPILGVMWSPVDKVSLGLSVRQTTILDSRWEVQTTIVDEAAVVPNAVFTAPAQAKGDDKREHPLITSLGIGYFPSNKLLLSADFRYYTATESVGAFPGREATWNAAGGIEYFPTGSWALRGGLFTNRSSTPPLSSNVGGQDDHYDMNGLSASVTKLTPTSSITGGVTYSMGVGDSQPYGDTMIRTVEANSLTVFLSSSYSY